MKRFTIILVALLLVVLAVTPTLALNIHEEVKLQVNVLDENTIKLQKDVGLASYVSILTMNVLDIVVETYVQFGDIKILHYKYTIIHRDEPFKKRSAEDLFIFLSTGEGDYKEVTEYAWSNCNPKELPGEYFWFTHKLKKFGNQMNDKASDAYWDKEYDTARGYAFISVLLRGNYGRYIVGQSLMNQGMYGEVISFHKWKSFDYLPWDHRVYPLYQCGQAHEALGEYEMAIKAYQYSAALDDDKLTWSRKYAKRLEEQTGIDAKFEFPY